MPKGYIISRVDILNPEAYARYIAAGTKAIADHGGKALARGGRFESLEGTARARNVILEFESYEAARTTISIPSNIRRRARCAKAPRIWRWFWSREVEPCPRATGSPTSTSPTPRPTSSMSRRMPPPSPNFGARFLVRAGRHTVVEGASRSRQVVIEFKDYETALACYRSEEYQRALALRANISEGVLVIAEGYDAAAGLRLIEGNLPWPICGWS